ncbi:MAG: lysophospholipid acyltransferase family protein [Candidatus Woesearchaeota archaeon]
MCLLKWFLVPLLKLYVKEAKGFENIPKQGPAILVANHASYIDPVIIRYFSQWHAKRTPIGIQSKEWLAKSKLRQFIYITLLKQIPTNGSIEKAIEALTHGKIILLFPEGSRTFDGKIQKCTHTGLGVLASETRAPVIPIGIKGTFEWWPRQKKLPKIFSFKKITITAGKPLLYSGTKDKKGYLTFQDKTMRQVARLID